MTTRLLTLIVERVVVDTGAYVSALLTGGTPLRAVEHVFTNCVLLTSASTREELSEVLQRPKFDRYISLARRLQFLKAVEERAQMISVSSDLHLCRDPKDDKFLNLARDGHADFLITGDADLLALHPFRKCFIITPAELMKERSM